MNPLLSSLHPYPFERLAKLFEGISPPDELASIKMSVGEPTHAAPHFIEKEICAHIQGFSRYPLTRGNDKLRNAIAQWILRRFRLPPETISPERNVLPVNGTREALFAFAQCAIDSKLDSLVLMPNPFYQIYEGAALLAGAAPWYLNTTKETGFLPDFGAVPKDVWKRCKLVYICSPSNPAGAVMQLDALQQLIQLSDQWNFIIASDECYSEIYSNEDAPPPSLLSAASAMGRDDYRNCIIFHSLSKRSNLPGLRSGFVAGDELLIERFLRYRTYHGCAMPPPTQAVSIKAWNDEQHVQENRELYRKKFSAVLEILAPVLQMSNPAGGFYLWPNTPISDTDFARDLFAQFNVIVLPGSYLSRDSQGINPGRKHIRIALVPPLEECVEAAHRIREYVSSL